MPPTADTSTFQPPLGQIVKALAEEGIALDGSLPDVRPDQNFELTFRRGSHCVRYTWNPGNLTINVDVRSGIDTPQGAGWEEDARLQVECGAVALAEIASDASRVLAR